MGVVSIGTAQKRGPPRERPRLRPTRAAVNESRRLDTREGPRGYTVMTRQPNSPTPGSGRAHPQAPVSMARNAPTHPQEPPPQRTLAASSRADRARPGWAASYAGTLPSSIGYLAASEEIIREHVRRSGFPATRITPVRATIDPTTASR